MIKPATVITGANQPTFNIGESDNSTTERILLLQSTLQNAGFNSLIPENIHVALWTKLMGIAALAGMESITRTSSGIWSQIPSLRTMFLKSMEETRNVAHSLKIEIPYREIEQRVDRLGTGSRSGTTSLHKDIVGGRPSEIEYQIGDIVRIGREHSINTPINSFLYDCLLPQEKVARKEI
jgi:2-dehydropantoate 2-reductase